MRIKKQNDFVFVLSSGFLAHEGLDDLTQKHNEFLKVNGKTIMLMPSLSLDDCVNIVVERQLKRGFGLKRKREEKKITNRFYVYKDKGDIKVFSNESPEAIAEEMKKELYNKFNIL